MKRILLSATFLLSCALGACASEGAVTCDVKWSANDDTELGTATIVYEGLDDVNEGLDLCESDQETHEERPGTAVKYTCDCST